MFHFCTTATYQFHKYSTKLFSSKCEIDTVSVSVSKNLVSVVKNRCYNYKTHKFPLSCSRLITKRCARHSNGSIEFPKIGTKLQTLSPKYLDEWNDGKLDRVILRQQYLNLANRPSVGDTSRIHFTQIRNVWRHDEISRRLELLRVPRQGDISMEIGQTSTAAVECGNFHLSGNRSCQGLRPSNLLHALTSP